MVGIVSATHARALRIAESLRIPEKDRALITSPEQGRGMMLDVVIWDGDVGGLVGEVSPAIGRGALMLEVI